MTISSIDRAFIEITSTIEYLLNFSYVSLIALAARHEAVDTTKIYFPHAD
jgi:hypothetical protein